MQVFLRRLYLIQCNKISVIQRNANVVYFNWRWNYSVGTKEIASSETIVHDVDKRAYFPTVHIKVLCTRHGISWYTRLIIFLSVFVWFLLRVYGKCNWFCKGDEFWTSKALYQISDSKYKGIRAHRFMSLSYPSGFFCIAALFHGDYNNDSYIKVYGPHETFLEQTVEIK